MFSKVLKLRYLLGKEPGSSHLQTDTAANRLGFSIPVDELLIYQVRRHSNG